MIHESLFVFRSGVASSSADDVPDCRSGVALVSGLCALLMFGPLAFGAVEPWSMLVLELGAALLLVVWAGRLAAMGRLEFARTSLYWPMALFAGVVAIQMAARRSAYAYETHRQALIWIAYSLLFFLATQAFNSESKLRRFAVSFSAFGFVVALFGAIQDFTTNGKLYWLREPRYGGWIYGPYVNHNHYAGLMEMLVPLPLVLALGRNNAGKRIALAFMASFMAGTIFLSQSRGGTVAFVAELLLFAVILLRHRGAYGKAVLLAAIVAAALAIVYWVGGNRLLSSRFHQVNEPQRLAIAQDSLAMVRQRPLLGWGLGAFPIVYSRFRTFYTKLFVNEAHDDYVQVLVETGVIGFAAGVWFVVLLFLRTFRELRGRAFRSEVSIRLAALTGCTGILVHSLVDFNMQIPANAALFFVLAAIASGPHPRRQR